MSIDEKKTQDWEDTSDDDLPPGEKHSFTAKLLGDLAKRALTTGIGAVFMSEETLRSQLAEMKLPKEAMNYVVGQADKTKKDIIDVIAREMRAFLSRLEVEDMIARMLTGTTIEINTRIRILPKEGGGVGVAVEKNDSALVRVDEDGELKLEKKQTEETEPKKKPRKKQKSHLDEIPEEE